MGVNAQTSVPAFTAGQVLTAAEMTEVNTGIPVFATTVTRDAAFGGTGEKVLAEGQMAYIEATNTTQYYDGAAWQTLGPSGMTLVASGSTSSAASLTLDGVFTSSYRNYKLFINGTASADDVDFFLNFRTGGATNSAASYTRLTTSSAAAGITRTALTGQTSLRGILECGTTQMVLEANFYAPQVAIATGYISQGGAMSSSNYQRFTAATFTNTTQFDGVIFSPGSGTFTIQYRLYGLAD
jgi:hypothetical protein